MPRFARTCALLAALALLAIVPAASLGSGPSAHAAAKSCHLSYHQQTHLGTTYVLSLRVRVTKCGDGRRIVKAFQKCRKEHHHRNGKCHHRVFGYKCSEKRFNKSSVSFDSKVRCSKSNRRVWHTYTQNT
ncbi:MAG TPA: hypothetical protein VGF21_15145 [Thermoleophilaceae bacterium]|jgi:hypothetical protein